ESQHAHRDARRIRLHGRGLLLVDAKGWLPTDLCRASRRTGLYGRRHQVGASGAPPDVSSREVVRLEGTLNMGGTRPPLAAFRLKVRMVHYRNRGCPLPIALEALHLRA